MIRLIIERPEQPPTLVAFPQAVVVVGRGAADGEAAPDWVLPFPDVSRRQCRFSVGGPEVFVEGLSERSATYVNGQRIARVTRLRAGDVVCFGRCSVRLAGEPAAKVAAEAVATVEPGPAGGRPTRADGAVAGRGGRAGAAVEGAGPAGSAGAGAGPVGSAAGGGAGRAGGAGAAGTRPGAAGSAGRVGSAAAEGAGRVGGAAAEGAGRVGSAAAGGAGRVGGAAAAGVVRAGGEDGGRPGGAERRPGAAGAAEEPGAARPSESGAASDSAVPEDMSPIVAQARRWESHGQPPSLLLTGDALRRGRAWLRGGGELGAAGVLVRRFVDVSVRARRSRFQRVGLAAAATALAVLGGSATARMLVPALERGEVVRAGAKDRGCRPEVAAQAEALVVRAEQVPDSAGRLVLASHALQVADRGGCRQQARAEPLLRRELAARRSRLLGEVAGPVLAAVGEPDGRFVAVADAAGKVAIWDTQGGVAAVGLDEGSGPADRLAWSGDKRWLATGGSGGEVVVWDVKMLPQAERAHTLPHRRGAITAVAFSPEGSLLASADQRGGLRLWDMGGDARGSLLGEAEGLPGPATQLVFDASAGRLYGQAGGRALVWKLSGPGAKQRLGVAERLQTDGLVTAMAVSLKGDQIVTGDRDGQVFTWSHRGPRWQPRPVVTHAGAVVGVQILAGSDRILSTAADRSLKLTELTAQMRSDSQPLRAEFDALQGVPQHLIVDPSGRRAFTVGATGAPELWDIAARRTDPLVRLTEQRSPVKALAAATQSSSVVTGGEDGSLRVWDLLLDGGSAGAYTLTDHRGTIDAVDFTRQGGTLASVGKDDLVRLWSVDAEGVPASLRVIPAGRAMQQLAVSHDGRWVAGAAGNLLHVWPVEPGERGRDAMERPGHDDDIVRLAFSPDGGWLVSADLKGTVLSWRVGVGGIEQAAQRTASFGAGISALAVSAEHVLAGTGGEQDAAGRVHLWPLGEDPEPTATWTHSQPVVTVAFDVDGQRVASGSADGSVITRALVRDRFEEREGYNLNEPVKALAYVNGGDLLAVGGSNGDIAVIDTGPGNVQPRRFRGHTGAVSGLAFAGGPELLLTAGHDGALLLWQLGAWQQGGDAAPPRVELSGHSGAITELRVDAAGHVAVTAGADRTLRIWPLETEALHHLTCRVAGRDLTAEERAGAGAIPATLCPAR